MLTPKAHPAPIYGEVRRKINNFLEDSSSSARRGPGDTHIVPQNVVTRFSYSTKAGVVPHNPYKVNQDQYLVMPKLLSRKYLHLFGICDGHGQLGREASYTTKIRLLSNL